MNLSEIKNIGKNLGVKAGRMKKEELIRAIQAAEGNNECYNTGQAGGCGQDDCAWQPDCDR